MKRLFTTLLLVIATCFGCATKGGWYCFAWQKNTDQKNEAWAKKQIQRGSFWDGSDKSSITNVPYANH